MVSVNTTALQVSERGEGDPALVFLHYFGGSGRSWDGVIDLLGGDYRCIAPDLRGFGQSAAPSDGYTLDDYAKDIAGLVVALGVRRYVLVGHSMGGKVALALAALQPPGLSAVVLIAPSPPTPEPIADEQRARLLASRGSREAAERTAAELTVRALLAASLDRFVEDQLRSSPRAWSAWLERGSRVDISARMPRISVPVCVLVGEEDPAIPPDLLEQEVSGGIDGARLELVPEVGHLIPLDAPGAVAHLIRRSTASGCSS